MRIYLDDCADDDDLIEALIRDGHVVFTPRTETVLGVDDAIRLAHAVQLGCALLTKNPSDFVTLHANYETQGRDHHGILLIYQEHIRSKNFSVSGIVQAIRNLEQSGIRIENATHNLNHWR